MGILDPEKDKEHFQFIMRTPMVDGGANTGVLVQEFLRGKEYIVDHVSRNGVHKTMMTWYGFFYVETSVLKIS